ncbi:hypothetical protein CRENBAI_006022 [Crenichthys baileyi]|uniref:Uncharacterized protein n=1 Tax=Crenichthys baileyi TaxID=28760 RepID=A0AAV9S8L7_9TELE
MSELSPDLNNTSVHCAFVPTPTCVDPRPELDRAALEISAKFELAIRAAGFRSLPISDHLSSLRYVYSTCYPLLPSLLCGSGGASRTLSRAASRRPAEDREIGMINNYNYWQTCQLLCGNGHP